MTDDELKNESLADTASRHLLYLGYGLGLIETLVDFVKAIFRKLVVRVLHGSA